MLNPTAAGPGVGASWRTIQLPPRADSSDPLTRRAERVLVLPDAANDELVRNGQPAVYYALPEVPLVARDSKASPVFSLTLVLSRSPAVHEQSAHHLIQQGIVNFDVTLGLTDGVIDALASSSDLTGDSGAVDVRPLFVRESRFALESFPDAHALAGAQSAGGTAVRTALPATLNREQTLGLLAALDGGQSGLKLTSEVTYRVSGGARRRLSGDWAAVYDFVRPKLSSPEEITREDLYVLYGQMVRAGVLVTSVSPTSGNRTNDDRGRSGPGGLPGAPPGKRNQTQPSAHTLATDLSSVRTVRASRTSDSVGDRGRLFDAFIRQAIVILRRLTPDLVSTDPGNVYALRARPSAGFRLEHEEIVSGSSLETITVDAPLEAVVTGLLDGLDRDQFIRLVSLTSGVEGTGGTGGIGTPPRPQRLAPVGGPRWPGDRRPEETSRGDRSGGADRIALAVTDGEITSVALRLRPEMASSATATDRNAQAMIASGVARPIASGVAAHVDSKLDWYLDDWRVENGTRDKPRPLPVVTNAADPIWPDRIDTNKFWYAPTFDLLKPALNAAPGNSPFLFSFRRIGETPSGPALEGEIRFSLRRGMSEHTRQALATRGNPTASPVPAGNLAVSLVLPFINSNDNQLTRHTCPCTLSDDGQTVTAKVGLTTQWVRIAYTLLSNPGAGSESARLSVAFSYEAYSVVGRFDLQLAFGSKQAMIPVVYSADQVREIRGGTYLDARAATLNFNGGSVVLKREAPAAAVSRDELAFAPAGVMGAGFSTAAFSSAATLRQEVVTELNPVAASRPSPTVLGTIATPAIRPGLDLAEIVREPSYALRTLLRQEQHDAAFPCEALGAFYRETGADDVAVGCRRAMELGQVLYRRYEPIPELDSVVGGEPRYQVYRSLQQPGRFLVLPAKYLITRHSPGTPDAYKPRLLLYSDEDPTRALRTPIIVTADLQPDIPPHARRELELKLALLTQTPVVEYPTAIECETAFTFHAMDSTPVTAFRTPDSFSVSISATAADWPLLFTRLQTGGVLGQVRFILGDGTELASNLTVDLRHITGPWAGGAVTSEKAGGGVRLTNRIDRRVDVHDLLIVSGTSSRVATVERAIAAGATEAVTLDAPVGNADVYAAYTAPSSVEPIEAVPNAIERIHVNVLFTNQILFSNHALTAMTIFARRAGSAVAEPIRVVADTSVAQADFLLPLTEYVARPVIQLRITKAFSDAHTETKEWFDWDLNTMGFVVSLTWDLVQ